MYTWVYTGASVILNICEQTGEKEQAVATAACSHRMGNTHLGLYAYHLICGPRVREELKHRNRELTVIEIRSCT